ncbi:dynein axonemal assembly factor 11 isoform X3 [Megalobrama amblycephala]|uniref:dynein axonemal assembly factor 11 isoform X3 n=1 Tax=Megalobrama amblycephala TaxID=75352 RepID=UPI002013C73F|nr:dynein axonemal assembly factor 11 isoform X3 [Megalobrama amblycephala]
MVRISEDLIRRRAEHNNGEIFSLEEVSLHQQDIERIEHIHKWCRDLKILYLQNNLIPKIENVGRLKKLEYLNLALNNIEVIENLEGCESLQKLDLTVNFVGKLSSVESLKQNLHLRELYLVGNPCADFHGYRQYVVAVLPQLQWLDGKEIGRAERIQALQELDAVRGCVLEQEAEYLEKREKQKRSGLKETSVTGEQEHPQINQSLTENHNRTHQNPESSSKTHTDAEDMEREFWEKPCAFTPESRLEAHRHLEDKKRAKEKEREKPKMKTPRTLITADGRVLNVNEPKLDFSLTEDENNCLLLDLHVYRHMDTSLLDVDVQPTYVRVTVKGKVFQLVLPAEVKPDNSTAQRSQTTGHLLLILPLAHGEIKTKKPTVRPASVTSNQNTKKETRAVPGRELLEVDPGLVGSLANIVPKGKESSHKPLQLSQPHQHCGVEERPVSKDFVDDPEVPPLISPGSAVPPISDKEKMPPALTFQKPNSTP